MRLFNPKTVVLGSTFGIGAPASQHLFVLAKPLKYRHFRLSNLAVVRIGDSSCDGDTKPTDGNETSRRSASSPAAKKLPFEKSNTCEPAKIVSWWQKDYSAASHLSQIASEIRQHAIGHASCHSNQTASISGQFEFEEAEVFQC